MGFFDDVGKTIRSGAYFKPQKKMIETSSIPALVGALRSDNALEDAWRTHVKALGESAKAGLGSGVSAGMGAFSHMLKDSDHRKPPKVGDAPPQGAGVTAARQEARRRAIAAARARMGLASTISTSPLGLQGTGAATGQRTLTGQ